MNLNLKKNNVAAERWKGPMKEGGITTSLGHSHLASLTPGGHLQAYNMSSFSVGHPETNTSCLVSPALLQATS